MLDARKMNVAVSVDQFLALLHAGGNDPSRLNEVLDENLLKLLEQFKIKDVADFVNDYNIRVKQIFTAEGDEEGQNSQSARLLRLTSRKTPRKLERSFISELSMMLLLIFLK